MKVNLAPALDFVLQDPELSREKLSRKINILSFLCRFQHYGGLTTNNKKRKLAAPATLSLGPGIHSAKQIKMRRREGGVRSKVNNKRYVGLYEQSLLAQNLLRRP